MKKIAIVSIFILNLINFSNLFAEETEDFLLSLSPKYKSLLFDYKIDFFSQAALSDAGRATHKLKPNGDYISPIKNFSLIMRDTTEYFSLGSGDPYVFSLDVLPYISATPKNMKDYSKTALEISGINVTVWAFNRYILKESWTNISLKSILWNLKHGFSWDIDTFPTNQFGHPYHGALHHSVARANGFNYFESSIFTFLGSIAWEFFHESVGNYNNPPSANDLVMNTLGGATLGEALFRIADLIIDDSSVGFERALRESLAFLLNPAYGFRAFSGRASKIGYPPEKHYYSMNLPFGAYKSCTNGTNFIIAANFEYKDFLKEDLSEINPYDWFSVNCRFGFREDGIRDKEIFTTGIIAGKKVKNSLTGLFGIFDYIDSCAAEKISAVGVGPGLVTIFVSDSDLFINSSGVLSLIFGGSSPSFALEHFHFGKKTNNPYYLGPGMLGRINLEFGKKGLGSIYTGFSQYWVHSIYTQANEFLGILSLDIKCDISDRSQISLGYDYYLRNATLQEQNFSGSKNTARALYVLRF